MPLAVRRSGVSDAGGACYDRPGNMKTISITIDEPLLRRLDEVAKDARRTRSDLFRMVLSEWLAAAQRRRLAAEDRAGYESNPVEPDEFGSLINAQGTGAWDTGEGSDW